MKDGILLNRVKLCQITNPSKTEIIRNAVFLIQIPKSFISNSKKKPPIGGVIGGQAGFPIKIPKAVQLSGLSDNQAGNNLSHLLTSGLYRRPRSFTGSCTSFGARGLYRRLGLAFAHPTPKVFMNNLHRKYTILSPERQLNQQFPQQW